MAYTLPKVKRLHKLFIDTLSAEHNAPAVKDWDAQDATKLAEHLNDRTPWIVVLPTHIDPTSVPAVWLIAQGVTIPEALWSADEEYRIWCYANAWRLAVEATRITLSPAPWTSKQIISTSHLEASHPTDAAGLRVFRVHTMTQKDAVLGAVRRAYMEVLQKSGSMAAADTADSLSHGSSLVSNKLKSAASEDAVDKAVLFIGTQCNWIKNPAFNRPEYLHALDSEEGSSGFSEDIVWYDYQAIRDFIMESAKLWHLDGSPRNALHVEMGKYFGTMLFGWSALYSSVDLPGSNSHGAMGDAGSLMRSLVALVRLGSANVLCYGDIFPIAGVATVDNPMWAFRFVCGSPIKYTSKPTSDMRQAYLPFPRTWRGEVAPGAVVELLGANVATATAMYGKEALDRIIGIHSCANLVGRVTSVPFRKEMVNANVYKFLPLLTEY